MSQRTEQTKESSEFGNSLLNLVEDWYQVPSLLLVVLFMMAIRLQEYKRFIKGATVYFSGNDPWYHYRQVMYTASHWPRTMPFDPWTYFPHGVSVAQFGTLYDQTVATVALILGLGHPSHHTIALTLLVAPAVFGALAAVPTYLIGKRIGGRLGGIFGVVVLALLPGLFLQRSLVGVADHNGVEPFFQAFAVLGTMTAIAVAEREKPVWELVADRDVMGLRRPLVWSVLAGVALAFYLWMWPPGVLLVGIFGVFYILKLTGDYLRGASPDHVAFVAVVSMATAGLLTLMPLGSAEFSATKFSLLQPFFAFLIAFGALFMAWLAREWESRDLSSALYPVAVFGILAVGVLFAAVALPNLFNLIQKNLIRFVGFGQSSTTATIGEAQPWLGQVNPQYGIQWYDVIIQQYGLMFFTAILGAALMVWRAYRSDEHDGASLLVLVWAVFITAAAFTQVRFNYYLVLPVAVLNAYLVGQTVSWADLSIPTVDVAKNVEGYKVITVLLIVLLIVPGLVMPIQIGQVGQQAYNTQTAMKTAKGTGPGAVTAWDGTLRWMANNTPQEGTYGGANNPMQYYGTYDEPKSGSFDYPTGAYGVMSWWDYGHWITARGQRIPDANPFQDGASTAANYLLATNESQANHVLDNMGGSSTGTKFVMVDWKMVDTGSRDQKFFAPIAFDKNVSTRDFYAPVYAQSNGQYYQAFRLRTQNYYDSMAARLYLYHGSAVDPSPVVVNYRELQTRGGGTVKVLNKTKPVQGFNTLAAAKQYVKQHPHSAQIGGVGPYPERQVSALQHYRLVKYSKTSALRSSGAYQQYLRQLMYSTGMNPQSLVRYPAWVKLFERVPGATVQGTAPANANVTATVQMRIPATGSTFKYTQHAQANADGKFTMTLPYATTGYDKWGPQNGYTNVSVRAAGPYQFHTDVTQGNDGFVYYNATAGVDNAKVIGEDSSPVTVSVDQKQVIAAGGANNSSTNATAPASGTSASGSTGGNSTAGNASALTASTLPSLSSPAASDAGRYVPPATAR